MRLPVTWLKDYVSFSYTPEKLSEVLTMSGTAVDSIESVNGESVLELEITTNRPDCLSLIGVSRELSALTGARVKEPALKKDALKKTASLGRFSVTIQDKKACPFYTARLIENVSISGAPIDVQKRLDWAGVRPISNAVDATNFVLFEMG
jgi:phenylalanyl-tRNA synthetase beta chain